MWHDNRKSPEKSESCLIEHTYMRVKGFGVPFAHDDCWAFKEQQSIFSMETNLRHLNDQNG